MRREFQAVTANPNIGAPLPPSAGPDSAAIDNELSAMNCSGTI